MCGDCQRTGGIILNWAIAKLGCKPIPNRRDRLSTSITQEALEKPRSLRDGRAVFPLCLSSREGGGNVGQ